MKKVLINSIINYYKENVLYIEENCNIINHLLKVIITEYVPQKRYIIKNLDNDISETKIREELNKENSKYYKELKKKCYDKNEIIRILLFSKETIYSLTDILNSCNHLNNLLEKFIDGSYIKKLEIQKPFYGCLIFGGFNEIVYQNEDNLYIACEFINNDRLYYKIIKKINVGLKYNSLYDIVKIKK